MNEQHLQLCASDEWADALRQWIVPGALAGVELGDDVLEVGPGPGRSTDLLREMTPRLTAVEADAALARALAARMSGTNVDVVHADATQLPFPDDRFSAAVSAGEHDGGTAADTIRSLLGLGAYDEDDYS